MIGTTMLLPTLQGPTMQPGRNPIFVNSTRRLRIWTILFLAVFVAGVTATGRCEDPVKMDACQLLKYPAAYNHKLVEVTGFVSHGFEDFTFFVPNCSSRFSIWLEYGGAVNSGTMYCCGVTNNRSRPGPLYVENIALQLIVDRRFREFDSLIQREPPSLVHATLVGRFFAGEPWLPGQEGFRGYGHMGCCSLLAIQQVLVVDSQARHGLDYKPYPDSPDFNGCRYDDLVNRDAPDALIQAQRAAELDGQEWVFHDPRRVAAETLARLTNTNRESINRIRWVQGEEGRIIYGWIDKQTKLRYLVEMSHPYVLAFGAVDPKKVAWVPIAIYQSECKLKMPALPAPDFAALWPASVSFASAPGLLH